MARRSLVLAFLVALCVPCCKASSRGQPPDAGATPDVPVVALPSGEDDNPLAVEGPTTEQAGPAAPDSGPRSADDATAQMLPEAGRPTVTGALATGPSTHSSSGLAGAQILGGGEVSIKRFVLCRSVAEREPVLPTQRFQRDRDGKIWAFIEAENLTAEKLKVSVTIESLDRPGARTPPVELTIDQGRRFRTWARITAWRPAGRYDAVVRDEAGNVVAREGFEVVE